jgi:hypothetical protein
MCRSRPILISVLHYLSKVVAELAIDVVHGYELPPAVALYFGPHLWKRVAQVTTVMGTHFFHATFRSSSELRDSDGCTLPPVTAAVRSLSRRLTRKPMVRTFMAPRFGLCTRRIPVRPDGRSWASCPRTETGGIAGACDAIGN